MTDPTRLADDPNSPELLRSLLSEARTEGLDAAGVTRVREGLETSIGPEGFSPSSAGLGAKAIGGVLVGGAIVVAALVWSGGSVPEEPVPAPVVAAPANEAPAPAPSVAPAPVVVPVVDPVPVAELGLDAETEPDNVAAVVKPVRKAADPDAEFKKLLAARRALTSDPAKALKLTQRHKKSYPKSVLAQEREVIAIRALVGVGRGQEATKRGRAFLSAHPQSSHRSAVETALAEAKKLGG